MTREITHSEYSKWYEEWLNNDRPHMGKHFCRYFNIQDSILEETDDPKIRYDKIMDYFLFGISDDKNK